MASPNPLRRGCKDCGSKPFVPCVDDATGEFFLAECHESRKAPSREAQKNSHMTVHHRVHLDPSVRP